jgi:hypothetical protein
MHACFVQVNATQNVEARISERLHIGGHISYRRLLEDLAAMGFSGAQVGVATGVSGRRLPMNCPHKVWVLKHCGHGLQRQPDGRGN